MSAEHSPVSGGFHRPVPRGTLWLGLQVTLSALKVLSLACLGVAIACTLVASIVPNVLQQRVDGGWTAGVAWFEGRGASRFLLRSAVTPVCFPLSVCRTQMTSRRAVLWMGQVVKARGALRWAAWLACAAVARVGVGGVDVVQVSRAPPPHGGGPRWACSLQNLAV